MLLSPVILRTVSDLLPAQEQRNNRERTAGANMRMVDLHGKVFLAPIVSNFRHSCNGYFVKILALFGNKKALLIGRNRARFADCTYRRSKHGEDYLLRQSTLNLSERGNKKAMQ